MAQPTTPAIDENGVDERSALEEILLNGSLQPPDPRVEREGAPDNRPLHRQTPLNLKDWIRREIMPNVFASQFRYSPISKDEIRILRIVKGKKEDPMHCLLFKRKLSDVKGCYEALSYCWGTERADCKIYIQDLHSAAPKDRKIGFGDAAVIKASKRFYVRPNLYAAMLQLRRRSKDINLWVDAICINQGHDGEEEKQQQLAQMAKIYNSAFNVCIWLGEADVKSNTAMQFIRKIMDFQTFDILMKNLDAKSQWYDIVEIMKAPWFSRRWIIQEVVMARSASVHCGEEVVHWDDFSDAVYLLNDKVERLRDRFGEHDAFPDIEGLSATVLVKTISNVCRKSDEGDIQEKLMDLETLVCSLQSFHSTFAHDTLYSLLPIAKDFPREPENEDDYFEVSPNYKRSTRDLYIAFVKRCIDTSRCLDIICRHWAPRVKDTLDKDVSLPSWVAKLSKSPFGLPGEGRGRQNGENFVGCSFGDARKRYNASRGTTLITRKVIVESPLSSPVVEKPPGDFPASMDVPPVEQRRISFPNASLSPIQEFPSTFPKIRVRHPSRSSRMDDKERDEKLSGILKVEGIKLGTVHEQSEVIRGGIIPGDWLLRAGWNKAKNQNRVPDKLWRTLIADRGPGGTIPPGWYQRACLHCLVDTRIVDGRGNLTVASHSSRRTAEMTALFLRRVESVVWNRRLFEAEPTAASNYPLFGLAPEEAKIGDEVCILFGCTVPVILRKTKGLTNSDTYNLVGEAYVHGKMDGEAVQDKVVVKDLTQTFELQ